MSKFDAGLRFSEECFQFADVGVFAAIRFQYHLLQPCRFVDYFTSCGRPRNLHQVAIGVMTAWSGRPT